MIGSYLPQSITGLDRAHMDVTSESSVRAAFEKHRPEAVIHLAAATDVDRAQDDRDYAFTNNTLGTLNIASACRAFGARLLYVSTGGVFDGRKLAASETDAPNPVNFYSWTKYEGERIVQHLVPHALILRAGWVMGGGPGRDHKFIGGLMKAFSENRPDVRVVSDRFGSPTYAKHFVARAIELLDEQMTGIWHCANDGVASRFEVAQAVASHVGYRGAVIPVSSEKFPTRAPRSRSEGLACDRLKAIGLGLPGWQDAVTEYLGEFGDA
jgi:dTDP-4-dehydrorhamnose reductase